MTAQEAFNNYVNGSACTSCGHLSRDHDDQTNRCLFNPGTVYTNPTYVRQSGVTWIAKTHGSYVRHP